MTIPQTTKQGQDVRPLSDEEILDVFRLLGIESKEQREQMIAQGTTLSGEPEKKPVLFPIDNTTSSKGTTLSGEPEKKPVLFPIDNTTSSI